MNLSTQLRIILLLAGAAIWLVIYLLGRRKGEAGAVRMAHAEPEVLTENTATFIPAEALDEEELDTPAYMRRQTGRIPRDYEPRIADADDYVGVHEVRDSQPHFTDIEVYGASASDAPAFDLSRAASGTQEAIYAEPVYIEPAPAEPEYIEPVHVEPAHADSVRHATEEADRAGDPDDVPMISAISHSAVGPEPVKGRASLPDSPAAAAQNGGAESPVPGIPVMAEHVAAPPAARPERPASAGVAPTLSQVVEAPRPGPAAGTASGKPAGQPSRRKIIALRLPIAERVAGAQLLALLQAERLQHGKFNIFHRMHDAGTVFSVASMVEPGSFDLAQMPVQQFPGVTLFMLLPGPLDGLIAYDQMLSCAQRLAHATGGLLHDERGSKLTPQSMERLRDEVLDFQHLIGGTATAH